MCEITGSQSDAYKKRSGAERVCSCEGMQIFLFYVVASLIGEKKCMSEDPRSQADAHKIRSGAERQNHVNAYLDSWLEASI